MSGRHQTHNTMLEHFQGPINTLAVAVAVVAAAELKGMMGNELLARGSTDSGRQEKRAPPSRRGRAAPDHPQIYSE